MLCNAVQKKVRKVKNVILGYTLAILDVIATGCWWDRLTNFQKYEMFELATSKQVLSGAVANCLVQVGGDYLVYGH